MRHTLFLMGPSNIEGQSTTVVHTAKDGRLKGQINWAGNMLFLQPFINGDRSLEAKSTFALVGIQRLKGIKGDNLNIFNMVGDADASSATLKRIGAMVREIRPRRFFNDPINVYKTSRLNTPKVLGNISKCRLPKVSYYELKSFREIESACDSFGNWPLIIRAAGYHNGRNMVLIDDQSQLAAIKDKEWLYTGIFLIEYIDYKDENNVYTKNRVIMVDGVPYARHSIRSDNPLIHSKNRADLMDQNDDLCMGEKQFLAYLQDSGLDEYKDVFNTIYERIGLDIFGIDFAIVDGKIVIFEANACMNFLDQDYGKDNRYRYLETYVRNLKRAVKKMLMTA